MARLLGYSRQSTEYHIAVLRRQGLVVGRPVGRATALTLPGSGALGEESFREASLRTVIDALRRQPGMSQQELAQQAKFSQSYISKILSRLERDGAVSAMREGARLRYTLSPAKLAD